MSYEDDLRRAKKRVKMKKGFYAHFSSYVIINAFLFFINASTGGEVWFIWPLMSWGVALAFHYIGVFGFPGSGIGGSDWEERQLEKEMKALGAAGQNRKYEKEDTEELKLRELNKKYDESDLV